MVPYADLINHSPFSGAYVDARQKGSWLFKEGTEEVILYADRSYRKMEQVSLCGMLIKLCNIVLQLWAVSWHIHWFDFFISLSFVKYGTYIYLHVCVSVCC